MAEFTKTQTATTDYVRVF